MSERQKKRHHYVPVAITKFFCGNESDRLIFLYDVDRETIISCSPRDAFVIKDYHTVDLGEGAKDRNTVEDAIMDFEDKGAPALRRFLETGTLTDEDRWKIVNLWAIQLVRTPVIRAGVKQFLMETVRAESRLLDSRGEFGPLPPELQKYGESLTDLIT